MNLVEDLRQILRGILGRLNMRGKYSLIVLMNGAYICGFKGVPYGLLFIKL